MDVTHVIILLNLKVVASIGPELSKIGSKPLTQFGFGHEKVEHSRDAWIQAHLINPRRWDNGLISHLEILLECLIFI